MSSTGQPLATRYLWEQVWARDSMLDLIQHFVQEAEAEDAKGNKTGERALILPRYHQLDAVRRLVSHARQHGPGERYLIQHSAGSGKSNSIAWLAHQLSVLHDRQDRRVFDSIVVITDRRVLDRQIQATIKQFEQTLGVVENIDKTSRQLKEALEAGKTIIVTTLQKFPVIVEQITALPGKRFAVIVDEAHSSQSGESTKKLNTVLSAASLEEAEEQDRPAGDLEDLILAEAEKRGRQANLSTFAFTATPKAKTIELFGTPGPDGKPQPFSLYTVRQAIEEGFILDVLANYTTYKTFWRLLKKIEDDPQYEKTKATYLLKSFVELHPHAIGQKVRIMADHFANRVAHRISGRAKAMIVTRSRLHAVKTKLALDKHLKDKRYPYKSLVAFSGIVRDGGLEYTESQMNGFPEARTAGTFEQDEYRFLVVANKFQTGFDQPLLHTMYVDKKPGGVNAVQTLSRLNRIHPPDKTETMVLDFANEAEEIQKAFQPYYEKTILSETTDPNLLYNKERRLLDFHVFTEAEVDGFAALYFPRQAGQDALYRALDPAKERFEELDEESQAEFKGQLKDYVRLYAFLSQVVGFQDAGLEKLYVFARLLLPYLPAGKSQLPIEVRQSIDIESFKIHETSSGVIDLERGAGELKPVQDKDGQAAAPEKEPLSQIIHELNERFGTDFTEEDLVYIRELEQRVAADPAVRDSLKVNTPENARLTFDHVVEDRLQEMVDTNFKLYKRVTDDKQFAEHLRDWLFERLQERAG